MSAADSHVIINHETCYSRLFDASTVLGKLAPRSEGQYIPSRAMFPSQITSSHKLVDAAWRGSVSWAGAQTGFPRPVYSGEG